MRCLRVANDDGSVAQPAQDPALQNFSGERGRAVRFLTERAANRQEIVTSHNNRNAADLAVIHRVRMIANVHDGWSLGELAPQPARKQNELVDVTKPFRDEAAGAGKISEERPRRDEFGGDAPSCEALQNHRSESLHALLPIERVITDQQNHWFGRCRQPDREAGWRTQTCAASVLAPGLLFMQKKPDS